MELGAERGGLGHPRDRPASPPPLCPAEEEKVVPEMILPGEICQVFLFAPLSGVAQPVTEGEIKGGSCSFNASRCRPEALLRPQHHRWGRNLKNRVQRAVRGLARVRQGQTAGLGSRNAGGAWGVAPRGTRSKGWSNTVVLRSCSVKNNTANRNRDKGMIQTKLTLASFTQKFRLLVLLPHADDLSHSNSS